MPTDHDSIDLGHEDEIMEAFVAYDRLVRWEEHNSRLDATEPIVERAYARGRIVALVANLAAQALGVTSDDSETTTPNTEPNPDSTVEAHVVRAGQFASVWRYKWPGDERWREHEVPNPITESLVAENARLREALTLADHALMTVSNDYSMHRLEVRFSPEYGLNKVRAARDEIRRALTSIEEGERHDD